MHNFPKWLPKNVAIHCQAKLNSDGLGEEQQQCIIRLTTHESMRPVWKTLSNEASNSPSKLVDLVEEVRLHRTILQPELKTQRLTAANRRKVMAQISKLSQNLLAAFAQLDPVTQDANNGTVIRDQIGKHSTHVFSYHGNSIIQVNTKTWRAALVKVGIKAFRWHDLRHTWASWHVQAGTPLHVLQELGGWECVEMVRKYAHFSSQHLTEYVDRLSMIQAGEDGGATFGLRAIK